MHKCVRCHDSFQVSYVVYVLWMRVVVLERQKKARMLLHRVHGQQRCLSIPMQPRIRYPKRSCLSGVGRREWKRNSPDFGFCGTHGEENIT